VHAGKPRVPITPATKVADLLDSWPELEEVLIAQAPAFRRLRNPVLRRTVARVATLEQAAGVGGVAVRDLVAALRRAAGLQDAEPAEAAGSASPASAEPPEWVGRFRLIESLDADALLDAGQVPLPLVRALGPGEMLRVDSAFRPVPLVDALARQGFRCHTRETAPGKVETFLSRG
jgi:hypothetical protein